MRSVMLVVAVSASALADDYPKVVRRDGQVCMQSLNADGLVVEQCKPEGSGWERAAPATLVREAPADAPTRPVEHRAVESMQEEERPRLAPQLKLAPDLVQLIDSIATKRAAGAVFFTLAIGSGISTVLALLLPLVDEHKAWAIGIPAGLLAISLASAIGLTISASSDVLDLSGGAPPPKSNWSPM